MAHRKAPWSDLMFDAADKLDELTDAPYNTDDPRWLARMARRWRALASRKERALEHRKNQGRRKPRQKAT